MRNILGEVWTAIKHDTATKVAIVISVAACFVVAMLLGLDLSWFPAFLRDLFGLTASPV